MKVLKVIILSVVVMTGVAACTERPRPDALAAEAARTYYDMLIKGNYELFVDGTYRPDSIPGSYRDQLVANARMYIGQQKMEHKGICEVRAAGARLDSAGLVGSAFLELVYGDSLKEQIVVPMICHDGVWYMR